MPDYGNRGKSLEYAINKLFERYASHGIHCQKNHPEQLYSGEIVKKHGFDFQILYNGKFYAFDAKECKQARWPLSLAKPHQLKALLDVAANGGEAFFLVYFTQQHLLIKFAAKLVQSSIINTVKSLAPQDGEPTNLNLLGIE